MDEIRVAARYEVSESDTAVDDVYRNAAEAPDHVIVSRQDPNGDWQPVTCRELADHVDAVASGLVAAGIAAGERVALMSRTRYEWMVADFAIMAAGGVTVPIYERSSDAQIEWILTDSGAVAAFVEDNPHAARLRGLTPHPSTVWTLDGDLSELAADGLEDDGQLARNRRDSIRSSDLATIVYTSGTTGQPKGCALTHANLVATVRNVGAADGVRDFVFNDTQSTLLFLPLAHILARIIQLSAIYQRVRLGHLADMKSLLRACSRSGRRSCCRCRACSRRSTTPRNGPHRAGSSAGSSPPRNAPPSRTARRSTAPVRRSDSSCSTGFSTRWPTGRSSRRWAATCAGRSAAAPRSARRSGTSSGVRA